MRKQQIVTAVAIALAASTITTAHAGVKYKDGDKYLKLGGRIQLQYRQKDPKNGASTDEVLLRRFRPYIEGSLHKDWKGKFQWDMGKASGDNELSVKDAYMQYKGIENMTVTIGNYSFPFSREFLTSSKYQQLVERTFVGDSNYGTPDRNAGVHLRGKSASKKTTWAFSVAQASMDPDASKLDFETPVNKATDWNEGWIVGGRIDFHPLGNMKFSQGDFERVQKATIGVAAYSWSNDSDNNTYTSAGTSLNSGKADIDSVTGLEISGAYRNAGLSIDAQYNVFSADTVAASFTGGMYRNGTTDLKNLAVKGGYMIIPSKFELVLGYQSQDADNYADKWNRTSFGANWFIKQHDIKVQLTYRQGENLNGIAGKDEDELFLQTQYVF